MTGKSVAVLYGYYDASNNQVWNLPNNIQWTDSDYAQFISDTVSGWTEKFQTADQKQTEPNYLSDGDFITFGEITDWNQLSAWSEYGKVIVVAHGSTEVESYYINGSGQNPTGGNVSVWGCNPQDGEVTGLDFAAKFWEIAEYLKE